jgi:hypothetical protein
MQEPILHKKWLYYLAAIRTFGLTNFWLGIRSGFLDTFFDGFLDP